MENALKIIIIEEILMYIGYFIVERSYTAKYFIMSLKIGRQYFFKINFRPNNPKIL